GLEKSTGEARRTLYERARAALVAQLTGVEPALNNSDITRERLALEEAIRRVEAEAARKTRAESPKPEAKVKAPDAKRWEAASRWDGPRASPEEQARTLRKMVPAPDAWPEPTSLRTPAIPAPASPAMLEGLHDIDGIFGKRQPESETEPPPRPSLR